LEFLPAKLSSRFLLPISSRQIDWSISIADFFPPNRGANMYGLPMALLHNAQSQIADHNLNHDDIIPSSNYCAHHIRLLDFQGHGMVIQTRIC
jgi:hypothetical protein